MSVAKASAGGAAAGVGRAIMLMVPISMMGVACRCAPAQRDLGEPPAVPALSAAPTASAEASASAGEDAGPGAADAAPGLPPLEAPGELIALPVEGFKDAVVSVPVGAVGRRPVVAALHGNFDRPEWQCDVWRDITDGYPFVLCPRGIPRGDAPKKWDRWTYGAMKKVQQELLAGLDALQKAFPDYVDDGPVVFTGFSLGAILGRYILKDHGERFPRAVLTEGGHKGWDWLSRGYQKAGGERVLFGCAQSVCVQLSRKASRHAERAGLAASVADGGNVGHTYDGPVAAAIKAKWPWVVAGDSRYPNAAPLSEPDADAGDDAGSTE